MTVLFVPKPLEARNEVLYDKLVPSSGNCDTLEGETLRAINRVLYRFYNDGDYWYQGYGIETAGAAEAFLRNHSPVDVDAELERSDGALDEDYERPLHEALEKIVAYVEAREEYEENELDMHHEEPKYEGHEDDDYYDGTYYDDDEEDY